MNYPCHTRGDITCCVWFRVGFKTLAQLQKESILLTCRIHTNMCPWLFIYTGQKIVQREGGEHLVSLLVSNSISISIKVLMFVSLRDTVSCGTALTWTLVFSLWKEFTSTWNQRYVLSTSRNLLCSVLLDFQSFTEKPVFEFAFAPPMILFYRIYNANWAEWSAIWSEIICVISKSNKRAARVRFEITSMISDQNCTTQSSIATLLDPFWNRTILSP